MYANFDWADCKLWLRSSDKCTGCSKACLSRTAIPFSLMNSYWHAGLVRNSNLNTGFTAAGRSGRHGLLKRKFGLKDYWKAKHWQWNHWHWKQRPCEWGVSFPIYSRWHLLVVEMGSIMQRVWHLSNVFPVRSWENEPSVSTQQVIPAERQRNQILLWRNRNLLCACWKHKTLWTSKICFYTVSAFNIQCCKIWVIKGKLCCCLMVHD